MGIREIQVAAHNFTVHELDDVYDSVTGRALTGSWVWNSALVLSHWMSTHLNFQGKAVVELGAGAGLPGLTAALLGASRVLLTDIQPLLPGLLKNVEANGFKERVEVRELVWGSETESGPFDVVLMSDVFYDPENMVRLGNTLERICREGTEVWAATELRPSTGDRLNELMNQGFQMVEVQLTTQLDVQNGMEDSNQFAIFQIICHVSPTPVI
ncbi:Nicotinamide N-methyltransferase-like protein [Corchorus olitorius]|uniref:Nicotinamide N-methyltransferase-like protein n=1 Tax=Corchorus olitorius TaxID=93759 RepID=A0A1R3JE28_9ROSI|nr:Nicotinamide N-methyltransferase-like protein [Corchorus olitorius]